MVEAIFTWDDKGFVTLPGTGLEAVDRVRLKVNGRPKTRDTTREKLRRLPEFPLPSIQDLCGVRIEGDFNLNQRDTVASLTRDKFESMGASKVDIKDMRQNPHSGYRAVHVHANLPATRIEVQIRTKLQSAWANMYEIAADILGRHIRYQDQFEGVLADIIKPLHELSSAAYQIDTSLTTIEENGNETYRSAFSAPSVDERLVAASALAQIFDSRAVAQDSARNGIEGLEKFKSTLKNLQQEQERRQS